ncbi:Smr/MutS family protein [Moraxella macacae]|nr:Smr/MutS family protein [Moraxella macacae]
MSNNLFSTEMQAQLQQLKTELSKGRTLNNNSKPVENVALPSKNQVAKQVKQYNSEHIDDDKLLFMQAMTGVRPIKDKNRADKNLANTNKLGQKSDVATLAKRAAAQGNTDDNNHQLSDMQALLNPVSGDTYLSYKIPTLPNKVFNALKQGKIRWHDAVDLHGSNIEQAKKAVSKLITQAYKTNESSVKIIHGKGIDSILKTCVNGWLRQIPEVLAFCSAPAQQGGNGAVLVLLKKSEAAKNA